MREAEQHIINHLKLLKDRWKKGILQFKKALENYQSNNRVSKTIRTAIHGDITLEGPEILLVDSFFLQRLKGVSHMGFVSFVYPEARHSRFEHSLGVFWIIKKLLESHAWSNLDSKDKQNLICASILHDIGHGPFSHSTEYIFECLGLDDVLRRRVIPAEKSKPHERRAKEMVLDEDFELKVIGCDTYHLSEVLKRLGADPETVCEMITGIAGRSLITALINGPVDADKLDYYQRDAYFTGVPAGNMDTQFMMRVLVQGRNGEPIFKEKAVSTLMQMLFSREYIYSVVPFHPVVRIAQAMFVVAFIEALTCLNIKTQIEILLCLEMMSDSDLWTILDIVASYGENQILKNLLDRLRCRELYKRWKTFSLDDCRRYGFGIPKREKTQYISDIELYVNKTLLPLTYLTSRDLNLDAEDRPTEGEILIFEIIPEPKSVSERKGKIKKDLEAIYIECENKKIRSLYSKLGSSKKSMINGLAQFQHFLNRAVLLHPSKRGGIRKSTLKDLIIILKQKRRPRFNMKARLLLRERLEHLKQKT